MQVVPIIILSLQNSSVLEIILFPLMKIAPGSLFYPGSIKH
jgi:hypothetical protein